MIFFEDIENLNNAYARYVNLLVELAEKYNLKDGIKEDTNLEQGDRDLVIMARQELRNFIIRSYLKYNAIKDLVKDIDIDEKKLRDVYEKARRDLKMGGEENIEKFVSEINKVFASSILSDILVEARDIYRQMIEMEHE